MNLFNQHDKKSNAVNEPSEGVMSLYRVYYSVQKGITN